MTLPDKINHIANGLCGLLALYLLEVLLLDIYAVRTTKDKEEDYCHAHSCLGLDKPDISYGSYIVLAYVSVLIISGLMYGALRDELKTYDADINLIIQRGQYINLLIIVQMLFKLIISLIYIKTLSFSSTKEIETSYTTWLPLSIWNTCGILALVMTIIMIYVIGYLVGIILMAIWTEIICARSCQTKSSPTRRRSYVI